MANIKNVLSSMINIQNDAISAVKYNNQTGILLTNSVNFLSGAIDNINEKLINLYVNGDFLRDYLSQNYLKSDEINLRIDSILTIKLEDFSTSVLSNYALKSEIPTHLSQLIDDLALTNDFEESDPIYAAESGQFQLKSEAFSGSYNDLTDKPTKLSDFTNDLVLTNDFEESDPVYAAQSGQFQLKLEAFSGSYNDLTDKPTIPTKLSDLTNNQNFISSYVETDPIYAAQSSQFALKEEIPTKLSDLIDDIGVLTEFIETDTVFKSISGDFATKTYVEEYVRNQINQLVDDQLVEKLSEMEETLNEIIN